MSATGRSSVRDPDDFYTSPSWTVRRLLEAWQPTGDTAVEPSAGNGAIIRAASVALPRLRWIAYEVREEELETLGTLGVARCCDFLTADGIGSPTVTAVIGNPPYGKAWEFIHRARALFPMAEVCYLLRLAFAASADRAPFMRDCPPDVYVLPDRPSFTGEGGDSADYGWMVWPPVVKRGAGLFRVLNTTPLEERKRDRGHVVMVESPQTELAL